MPYTPTTWVENVTTLGPTNLNKIEQALVLANPAYGTTLPGSPADGQLAVLVDSTTNPSYQWCFRYNSGSSSAYKWEFVGGSSLHNDVNVQETSGTPTVWSELTTQQRITIPRAGDYEICGSATGSSSIATDTVAISGSKNTVGTVVGQLLSSGQVVSNNGNVQLAFTGIITALAASDLMILGFIRLFGSGAINFTARSLQVRPIRVS